MGVGTAIGVGSIAAAGIGGAASIVGAGEQAGAAKSAAQLQFEEQQQALDFQKQQFQTTQAEEAPFIKAGQGAVNTLAQYAPFAAPTPEQAAQEPGYQFQLQQGEDAVAAEAARTGAFSGTQLRAGTEFANQLAGTNYGAAYNRALNTYETNLNRLQSLAGEGQTATGQAAQAGQAAASNVGAIDIASGRNIAQEMNNAAAAEASGYIGASNAVGGAVNSLSQYALLKQFLNPQPTDPNAGLYTDPGTNVLTPTGMPGYVPPGDLVPPAAVGVGG